MLLTIHLLLRIDTRHWHTLRVHVELIEQPLIGILVCVLNILHTLNVLHALLNILKSLKTAMHLHVHLATMHSSSCILWNSMLVLRNGR